jgi:hypothetical protein
VLKDICCRLNFLSLEAFLCLEVQPFGHDRSVLLSIVTLALLLTIVCRSIPSHSSGDVVDGCQWEVQASKR